MPETKDGYKSIETQVPEDWVPKIKRVKKKKGMSARREYLRTLVYDNLKKEGEL